MQNLISYVNFQGRWAFPPRYAYGLRAIRSSDVHTCNDLAAQSEKDRAMSDPLLGIMERARHSRVSDG